MNKLQEEYSIKDWHFIEAGKASDIMKQMNEMRKENFYTDVTIRIDDQEFPCHRAVLAASSKYFTALFTHDETARTGDVLSLHACHITPSSFDAVLDFMYTGKIDITQDTAMDILEVADFLQYRNLAENCASIILQHLTVFNCLMVEELGARHSCKALESSAHQFILQNFTFVIELDAFLKINFMKLVQYISNDACCIKNEERLLERLCCWINANDQNDIEKETLLKYVRWEVVSASVLINLLNEWPWLKKFDTIFKDDKLKDLSHDTKALPKSDDEELQQIENLQNSCFNAYRRRPKECIVIVPRNIETGSDKRNFIWYYHPTWESWKVLTKLPFKGKHLYGVTVVEDSIYITGGEEYQLARCDSMKFESRSNEWIDIQPLLKPRANHSTAALEAKIYVVGGKGQQKVHFRNDGEEYDPKTDQWTLLPNLYDCEGIARCALAPLDGRLYLLGGIHSFTINNENHRANYTKAQCYIPHTNTWVPVPELETHIQKYNIAVGLGDVFPLVGQLLIIDEDPKGKKMMLYNPVTGKIASFLNTHGSHRLGGTALLGSWKLYCTGGMERGFNSHDLVHSCDLTMDTADWQMQTSLPVSLTNHAATVMYLHDTTE